MTKKLELNYRAVRRNDELAKLSLLDIRDVCAAVRMSGSWVHDEVKAGRFPQPLRFGPRCTRWTVASIRNYLIERAAQPQTEIAVFVAERAKKASIKARQPEAIARAKATRAARLMARSE